MRAMILVAGKGTRLGSLTETRPKPMLPVGGKPLLEHTVEWLRDGGIIDIVMNPGYLADQITNHFGNGRRFGVDISYSRENELLGTAGGVKAAEPLFDKLPLLVVYGDNYYRCNLQKLVSFHLFRETGWGHPRATLGLTPVHYWEYSGSAVDVDLDQRVTGFVEKPVERPCSTSWQFGGLMLMNHSLLDTIPEKTFADFGHNIFPQWIRFDIKLGAVHYNHGDITDIGTPANYWSVNNMAGECMD